MIIDGNRVCIDKLGELVQHLGYSINKPEGTKFSHVLYTNGDGMVRTMPCEIFDEKYETLKRFNLTRI